jgi:hypothetical protein
VWPTGVYTTFKMYKVIAIFTIYFRQVYTSMHSIE